jgi:hypothetical protein
MSTTKNMVRSVQNTGSYPVVVQPWVEPFTFEFRPDATLVDSRSAASNDTEVVIDSLIQAAGFIDPVRLAAIKGLTDSVAALKLLAKKHFDLHATVSEACSAELHGAPGFGLPRLVVTITLSSDEQSSAEDIYARMNALSMEIAELVTPDLRNALEVSLVLA